MDRDARYFQFAADRDPKLLEHTTLVLHGRMLAGVLGFCGKGYLQDSCQLIYVC